MNGLDWEIIVSKRKNEWCFPATVAGLAFNPPDIKRSQNKEKKLSRYFHIEKYHLGPVRQQFQFTVSSNFLNEQLWQKM